MQIIATVASLLALAATVVGRFISTLSACQPSLVTYGGGTPPYIISAFPAGVTTGNPLLEIAPSATGTSFTWNVNLPAGQTITLGIKDQTGASQFSGQITIATGGTDCLNSTSISISAGPTAPGGSTTTPGGSSPTSTPSGTTPNPASTGTSGTSRPSSGSSGSPAASASSPTASKSSALALSAGPAAIIGMVLGAFLA
ncbi:hypothetical protein BU17DRAFT_65583 [Hysterangium stoloniferum]|nr:hypothetical protein BU17DRAFT_65583 [Hysterangium stoloniferum]